MVTALVFAGGTGQRMNSRSKPKQFLELHGKPIIIYTIEILERHPEIDNIVVVCLESWIKELKVQLNKNLINKVSLIVPGGDTGHDSIYNGLEAMASSMKEDDIVLIHDGVRPLVTEDLISQNIRKVKECGNAISVAPAAETVTKVDKNGIIVEVPDRSSMYIAKAPQSFYFKDIWKGYQLAHEENFKSIDSAHLMNKYGYELHIVPCSQNNMKITAPSDYYLFRALYEAMENQQIFGI